MIAYAVWGGWQTPSFPEAQTFFSGPLGWLTAFAPLLIFSSAWFLPVGRRTAGSARLEALTNRILGANAYGWLFHDFGIAAWLGTGALLHGVVGLGRSLSNGASESVFLYSTFYISGGIGMLIAYFARRRRLDKHAAA
jgi:hypothetical protein